MQPTKEAKIEVSKTSSACTFCTNTLLSFHIKRLWQSISEGESDVLGQVLTKSVFEKSSVVSTLKCNDNSKIAKDSTDDISRDHTLTRSSSFTSIELKLEQDGSNTHEVSSRSSLEPPQSFSQGWHVGENAGTSFLCFHQNRQIDSATLSSNDSTGIPFIQFEDVSHVDSETLSTLPQPVFTREQIHGLLDKYLNHVSPTSRLPHLLTVRDWPDPLDPLHANTNLADTQKASALLVCAQTLFRERLIPASHPRHDDFKLSLACSERAKSLFEHED